MEKIFENKYCEMYFNESNQLFYNVWTSQNRSMKEEEIEKGLKHFMELILQYKSKIVLNNDSKRLYRYSHYLQELVVKFILDAHQNYGLEKFCVVEPEDLINGLAISLASKEFNKKVGKELFLSFEDLFVAQKSLGITSLDLYQS